MLSNVKIFKEFVQYPFGQYFLLSWDKITLIIFSYYFNDYLIYSYVSLFLPDIAYLHIWTFLSGVILHGVFDVIACFKVATSGFVWPLLCVWFVCCYFSFCLSLPFFYFLWAWLSSLKKTLELDPSVSSIFTH